jgi:hypothetical protein
VDTLLAIITSEPGSALAGLVLTMLVAAVAMPQICRLALCWRLCRARKRARKHQRELAAMLDRLKGDATSRLDQFQRELDDLRDG